MLVENQKLAAIDLDDSKLSQLLGQLLSGDSDVQIAPTAKRASVAAAVTQVTDEAIELAIDRDAEIVEAIQSKGSCRICFMAEKEQYYFDAAFMSADRIDGAIQLRLRRPKRVSLQQRRRFWRTPVQESTTVELRTEHNALDCEGAMLNVSAAGMACRVDRCYADGLRVGGVVHARFRLDGDGTTFSIDTELKAVTPTSDSARIILRLEFRWNDNTDARDRLDRVTRPSAGIR